MFSRLTSSPRLAWRFWERSPRWYSPQSSLTLLTGGRWGVLYLQGGTLVVDPLFDHSLNIRPVSQSLSWEINSPKYMEQRDCSVFCTVKWLWTRVDYENSFQIVTGPAYFRKKKKKLLSKTPENLWKPPRTECINRNFVNVNFLFS